MHSECSRPSWSSFPGCPERPRSKRRGQQQQQSTLGSDLGDSLDGEKGRLQRARDPFSFTLCDSSPGDTPRAVLFCLNLSCPKSLASISCSLFFFFLIKKQKHKKPTNQTKKHVFHFLLYKFVFRLPLSFEHSRFRDIWYLCTDERKNSSTAY